MSGIVVDLLCWLGDSLPQTTLLRSRTPEGNDVRQMLQAGWEGSPLLDSITERPVKRDLYEAEVYYREGIADCVTVWPFDTANHLWRLASAILKPEAVAGRMLDTCLESFALNGFRVVAAKSLRVDRLMFRELWRYRLNVATPERLNLLDLQMSAAPSLYVLLDRAADDGVSAVARLKALKGPSAPDQREPHQLRYRLGCRSHLINYLHAPDEPADFVRELAILFDSDVRLQMLRAAALKEDLMAEALRLGRMLYERVPAHDLSAEASLDRLAIAARSITGLDACVRTALAVIEEIAAKKHRDWRTLFTSLDNCGIEVSSWDRIVLLAELVEMRLPGREPLL